MQVGEMQRISLGEFPTPLQELKNLSEHLEGPRIFLKRDDLDGLGAGGNKLRKLEFAMADALETNATVVVTTGAVQTNHGRLTLAAANRLNLETVLLLTGEEPDQLSGNVLLDKIMEPREIHYVEKSNSKNTENTVERKVDAVIDRLKAEGEKPYYIPIGCSPLHGTLGYSTAVLEIVNQLNQENSAADYLITPTGTASTQAGLVFGSRLYSEDQLKVIGINVSYHDKKRPDDIAEYTNRTAKFLDLDLSFNSADISNFDNYVGEGYSIPTKEMKEAVKLVADKEGIILDPVYTGKAMAGLIDMVRKNKFNKGDIIVFIHTGGVPGLFAKKQADFFQ